MNALRHTTILRSVAASAALAFVAGRRSTRRWPVRADDRRAEATPGG